MACQRCTSKSVATAPVTVSLPNRDQGHRGETIEVEQELCGPCRTITAAAFPVEGGEELAIPEEPESLWEHTGGGWFTNRETGEKVRGNPEDREDGEEEEEEEGEGDAEGEGDEAEEKETETGGGEDKAEA